VSIMKITVIGAGSWGTALANLLSKNGHEILLWAFLEEEARRLRESRENVEFLPGLRLPESIEFTASIELAASFGEMFLMVVPSKFVGETIEKFSPYMRPGCLIVNAAKGLDEKRLLRLSDVISNGVPGSKVAVLSGPSHAEEVARYLPTTCVAASDDPKTAEKVQDIFMCPEFRVYASTDVIGVELGGAVKNVIALAAGISDGMGYGDNAKAALMTRGIAEITRLGVAMGGQAATFAGLSGIGDLIVTCTSMHSRNRRAGILLGQGKSLEETLETIHMVVEGVNTAKTAYALSVKYDVDMPITYEINKVLFEGKNPGSAVNDLMTRDKTHENLTI